MTISELIEQLSKFEPTRPVRIECPDFGRAIGNVSFSDLRVETVPNSNTVTIAVDQEMRR